MLTFTDFLQRHQLSTQYLQQAEQAFSPIIKHIASLVNSAQNSSVFVGINGCQGSGKSTLADYLATELTLNHQLKTVFFSLDDFYLDQIQRDQLANNIHLLLKTRGVPGTHNIELLNTVINGLKKCERGIRIPVFDKLSDNPKAKKYWQLVYEDLNEGFNEAIDVVIIEGWCWGTPAQKEEDLIVPVNELERSKDPQRIWRSYVNQQLKQFYQPLFKQMDISIMLKVPSFDCVSRWRLEQEQKRIENQQLKANQSIMNKAEIENFVQYFQRLTQHSLLVQPSLTDYVFELDQFRNIK